MNIRAKIYGGVEAVSEPILKRKSPKGAKTAALDSVAVPREQPRQSNSRVEDRHRLSGERASVTYQGRDREVELINLSGGGAMVAGAIHPNLWDRTDLHLGDHGTIECAVIWVRNDRVGLEFAHETRLDCSSDQLATVLRGVIQRSFPDIEFAAPEQKTACDHSKRKADDHRRAPRHPLIWGGVLHHDYQSTPIRLRNVSETGALIQCDTAVRVGAQPLLEFTESISISVTVEWAVGDLVGLRFNEPFDLSLLAESKPAVAQTDWTPPAYLTPEGKAVSANSYWDRLTLEELSKELEGFLKR